jgi:hypothetical protein
MEQTSKLAIADMIMSVFHDSDDNSPVALKTDWLLIRIAARI